MQTFTVYFTDPAESRFGSRSQAYWGLSGKGEAQLEADRLVIRGSKPRPFLSPEQVAISLRLSDIYNVIREHALVQCHVRVSGATQVLHLWCATDEDAEKLLNALPTERTAEFDQQVAEHSSFNTELDALGGKPVVTLAVIILNCAIFACTVYAGAGLVNPNGAVLVEWGTNYGPLTLSGEWWRLFTSMFLHFGVIHIALNMWALWGIGQLTEKLYGSAYFLVLYLFAGLAGSIASLYWHSNVNSAGASGAIFGVIGGMLAFVVNPKTRIPASIATAHRNSAGLFILYNLFNGFALAGIDNAAHIGGLVGGFAMGWLLARPVKREARRDPLPRLTIGTLLGAVVLIALAWQLGRTH